MFKAMIKRLLLIFALTISVFSLNAQEWSITLAEKDGLPGDRHSYNGQEYYYYSSPLFTPGTSVQTIRITVIERITPWTDNGDKFFALSQLSVYNENGYKVGYTASSNANHNDYSYYPDGAGIECLTDNNLETYFHSYWGNPGLGKYHYIELYLEDPVNVFSLEWYSRLGKTEHTPILVGITLGTDYTAPTFNLGETVTNTKDLNAEKQWFVLKGNATSEHLGNYADGTYNYNGCGEQYINCAENGDSEVSIKHTMQLIPVEDDRFIIYFPLNGKYLKNSAIDYNGKNGWQYSTTNIEEAAEIKLTPTGNGYFEMQYDGIDQYNNKQTLYIGAEPRPSSYSYIQSCMKTFDLEHKQALEQEDYTQGFSLPVNFNWSIYTAIVDDATIEEFSYSKIGAGIKQLNTTISNAKSYLNKYDHFNWEGYNEYISLSDLITSIENNIDNYTTSELVNAAIADIEASLSRYMFVKFKIYKRDLEDILNNVTFTEYPYKKDTYPSSSRSILESIINTVYEAESNPEAYQAEWYESMFIQFDENINLFYNTIITEDSPTTDNNGSSEVEGEIIKGEYVYLYLANGGVEAYSREALDGDYYIEGDKIFFPLKGGDVDYYTKEEYTECSTTPPTIPEMATFKFNNKYNPNLFVDAVAEEVSNEMFFSLNSIGKWLTASFTLNDNKAVAYVNGTPQESKVTRQNFSKPVTYCVSYPKYYRTERIKLAQGEGNEIIDGDVVEIPLSADDMYTNKPSTASNEGFASLLDNNPNTIFHSAWGNANIGTEDVDAYITIALPDDVKNIKVYYQCRPQSGYNPKEWEIYASNDGYSWTLVRTLNYLEDNMPTGGYSQEYTSPTINLGGSYSHIKILQTQGEYSKNHLAIAELRLYKVEANTGSGSTDNETYKNVRLPLGNEYKVTIDWLTDTPTVPRIDIDIDGGYFVTSKDYYLNANFKITGYGIYEDFEDSVQIKGRGNTSWGYSKKPYRLKFEEKVKPFGLTKGKSWVLLANAQKGSLMANAVSMKIGQMAGSQYTNHIVPVELYMNGSYMGSYMFTEKVGLANNSVDVDEDTGYLLELDTYYDEVYKFKTEKYELPVNIKEPDLTEYDPEIITTRYNNIKEEMNRLCDAVYYDSSIDYYLDMDAFARFYLANDLSLNQEINHPKSTFLFKEEENNDNSKFKFGPIWDFDWGYGYEGSSYYCSTSSSTKSLLKQMNSENSTGYGFWVALTQSEIFKKYYYKVWKEFLENNSIDELLEYIDSYYHFAQYSFQNNTNEWGSSYGFTESDRDRLKGWIQTRAEYIYDNIDKVNIDDLLYVMLGDANSNNQLTIHDIAVIVAYLNNTGNYIQSTKNADCNKDNGIDWYDVEELESLVMESQAPDYQYWNKTPFAAATFCTNEQNVEIDEQTTIGLELSSDKNEKYNAFQLEFVVPAGISVLDITKGSAIEDYTFSYSKINEDTYRVIAYSEESKTFNKNIDEIVQITINTPSIMETKKRRIDVINTYLVDNKNNELLIDDYAIKFGQVTSIKSIAGEMLVNGGDCISITVLEPRNVAIYSIDGRKIRDVICKNGTTQVKLPAGVYIVEGNKVTIK